MKKIFAFLLFSFLFLTHYVIAQHSGFLLSNDLEELNELTPWTNQHTRIKGDAYSGEYFSRTDSLNHFSYGWKGPFPADVQGQNLFIRVSEMCRVGNGYGNVSLVLSVLRNDSVIYWENKPLHSVMDASGDWIRIEEDFKLPANITGKGITLLVYTWNDGGKVVFDIDDLSIEFGQLNLPSYLIPSDTLKRSITENKLSEIYSGTYFKLKFDQATGSLVILSPNDHILLHSFALYNSWSETGKKESRVQHSLIEKLSLKKDSSSNSAKYFTFSIKTDIGESLLQLMISYDDPVINFKITSTFSKSIELYRQTLSASFEPELQEVIRNSGKADRSNFQEEYWLKRGGIQVYSEGAGFVIYPASGLSSMQLCPPSKRVIFNLDWEMDHPLFHWPLRDSSENLKVNRSSTIAGKKTILRNEFTIQGTINHREIPVLMKYPEGRKAAMIWTEHADFSDINLQRAVNFGNDSILDPANASGGFVGRRIPVTKSVFYSNPDSVSNTIKAGFVNSQIANIKSTEGFTEYLFGLAEYGQEICLHTPDHFTSSAALMEEALQFMSMKFKSVNWIDHGYDNAPFSNRENLVCDGLNVGSELFSLDLWKKYGIRYLWNCFYEDTSLYSAFSFNSFFSLPYAGWGDRFPVPEYWKHISRSENLVHWRTTGTLDPPDGSMWNYFFSEDRLQDMLENGTTAILHVYPSRADSSNGYYIRSATGFSINPEFDNILFRQSELRDRGLLHLVTVQDYIDYQLTLDQVEYRILTNGKISIENKSGVDIKGITFTVRGVMPGVRGKKMLTRNEDDVTFFWFDLRANEVVYMDIVK